MIFGQSISWAALYERNEMLMVATQNQKPSTGTQYKWHDSLNSVSENSNTTLLSEKTKFAMFPHGRISSPPQGNHSDVVFVPFLCVHYLSFVNKT